MMNVKNLKFGKKIFKTFMPFMAVFFLITQKLPLKLPAEN